MSMPGPAADNNHADNHGAGVDVAGGHCGETKTERVDRRSKGKNALAEGNLEPAFRRAFPEAKVITKNIPKNAWRG